MTLADAARRLNSACPHAESGRVPPLVLVTDSARLADPIPVLARLPRGSAVLFRHYETADRSALAKRLTGMARRRGILVLVAGDWRLAARVGAGGLHLPEHLGRPGKAAAARGWAKRKGVLLTVACHSVAALERAARLGANAALLSPVFPTASHPGAPALGPFRFRMACRRAKVPVIALGGISQATIGALAGSGAAGLAAIGAFSRK